jgi:DNA-binding FadR family transcriptional regulator
MMGFRWAEATMADYHEVRSALEPLICQHAARHRGHADIRALRAILADMAAHLSQPRAYASDNTAFHRRIAGLSPNAPLRSLYLTLLDFYEASLEQEQLPTSGTSRCTGNCWPRSSRARGRRWRRRSGATTRIRRHAGCSASSSSIRS